MSSPALPPSLGGQAVIEGVLIRGPRGSAVCVRRPDGEILVRTEHNKTPGGFARLPLLRGIAALGETMTQGMGAMVWSAQVASGSEPQEPTKSETRAVTLVSMAFVSSVFILGPAVLSRRLQRAQHNSRLSALMEGALRIGTLIGYLRTIGRLPQAQRLFAYHGAEHRAIQAYEAGEPLEVESLYHFPNEHVRCGTSFLLTATLISSVLYAAIGAQTATGRLLTRLALMPVVVGLSYEAIRQANAASGGFWRLLFRPNMMLQGLTTRDPDEGQMEVALAAVRAALALHQQ